MGGLSKEDRLLQCYRSDLCTHFEKYGKCRYGKGCMYAHGKAEQRQRKCGAIYRQGYCNKEALCQFSHDFKERKGSKDQGRKNPSTRAINRLNLDVTISDSLAFNNINKGKARLYDGLAQKQAPADVTAKDTNSVLHKPDNQGAPVQKPVCQRFLVGECAAGDLCRYRHDFVQLKSGLFGDPSNQHKLKSQELDLVGQKKVVDSQGVTRQRFEFDEKYKAMEGDDKDECWAWTENLKSVSAPNQDSKSRTDERLGNKYKSIKKSLKKE